MTKQILYIQKNENHLIKIQISNLKGGIHLKNKELQKAINAFEDCLKYSKILKADDFKINSMCNLGEAYFESKDYVKAEKYYLKSLKESIKIKHKYLQLIISCQLNQLYFHKDEFDKSIEYGNDALILNEKINDTFYARHAHLNNYKSYKAINKFKNALNSHEKYLALDLKIKNDNQKIAIQNINKDHKLELKKLEIELEEIKNKNLHSILEFNETESDYFLKKLTPKELELCKLYAKKFKKN